MKLTDRIIYECIRNQFDVLECKNLGIVKNLRNVLIFTPDTELEQEYIYIVENPMDLFKIKRIPTEILLIIKGEIPDWMFSVNACIVLKSDVKTADLLNCIIHCYRRMEDWDNQMEQVLRKMGRIDDLLQIACRFLGNPVLVFRDDVSVIAQAYEGEKPDYIDLLENYSESMQQVNALIQDERYRENLKKDCSYWGLEYIEGVLTINWNIKRKGETVYILTVAQCGRKLTEADGDVLMLMGRHFSSFLMSRGEYGSQKVDFLHKTLTRIISDKDADYMEISWDLENLGWNKNHEYLCLVFESALIDQGNAPISLICNYMENQIKGCSSFSFKNKVVNYINLNQMDRPLKSITSDLTPFIRDSFLKAGYSRVMTGHMNLRRQYLQSRIALDEGTKMKPYLWIHYFDQIARYYIFNQICRTLPAEMVCHDKLILLQKYDRLHNTEYMESLKVYLDNQQNAVRTARELSIHRSTFLYRLDKIIELTGLDLEDPEEVLYLSLSFRILEREETENKENK